MKRTPLKTKTGFKPRTKPMNRGTSQLARSGRLNHRSKTNSRKHESRSANDLYRDKFPTCEISYLFPANHPLRPLLDWRGHEVHHILWGQAKRHDIVTNLITLTTKLHKWHDANKADCMALCLWVKLQKGELNYAELHRISDKEFPGWIEIHTPKESWILPKWRELLKVAA